MQTLPAWVPLSLPRLLPVNSFPVRSPQLACTSFVQFDGVVCGFCPGLSLSPYFTCPHFCLLFCLFFVRWLKQKLQQKFWGRFIGSFLLQLALHLKCPMVGHKLLKPGQCSTSISSSSSSSTKMQPRSEPKS